MLNISSNQIEFTKQTLGMVIEAPMREIYFDHVQKDRKKTLSRGRIRSFSGVLFEKKHKTDLFVKNCQNIKYIQIYGVPIYLIECHV